MSGLKGAEDYAQLFLGLDLRDSTNDVNDGFCLFLLFPGCLCNEMLLWNKILLFV